MISRDLLWKGIITSLVDDFLAFFFPKVFPLLDLQRGVEFLDKELEQLFPNSIENHRYVDKLIKVFLLDGTEEYFLVHVEVQGYVDNHFSERMFIYFYRLFDRYRVPITALAIFTDNNPNFHPKSFHYKFLDTELTYRFKTYKLMEKGYADLEKRNNPFAIVMEAARWALDDSIGNDEIIYENKFRLIRKLIDQGHEREKIRTILSFIIYYQPFFESKMSSKFEENLNVMDETKGLVELIKEELLRQNREAGKIEGLAKGIEEGREEGREEVIKQLLNNGLSLEELAELIQIPIEELEEIKRRTEEED